MGAKDQDQDKDLSKCGYISVNIPGTSINAANLRKVKWDLTTDNK